MPWLAQVAFDKITKGGIIVGVLSMSIFVAIDVLFGRYESTAEGETGFASESDGWWVNAYFVAGMGALAATILAAHFINLYFPPIP